MFETNLINDVSINYTRDEKVVIEVYAESIDGRGPSSTSKYDLGWIGYIEDDLYKFIEFLKNLKNSNKKSFRINDGSLGGVSFNFSEDHTIYIRSDLDYNVIYYQGDLNNMITNLSLFYANVCKHRMERLEEKKKKEREEKEYSIYDICKESKMEEDNILMRDVLNIITNPRIEGEEIYVRSDIYKDGFIKIITCDKEVVVSNKFENEFCSYESYKYIVDENNSNDVIFKYAD